MCFFNDLNMTFLLPNCENMGRNQLQIVTIQLESASKNNIEICLRNIKLCRTIQY